MESYFAQAPLINYIGATLWIVAPVIIGLLVLAAITRNFRLGAAIVGFLLLIGSVPIAFMSETSINGCCGAPSTGHEGLGYLIGVGVAVSGAVVLYVGKRHTKSLR